MLRCAAHFNAVYGTRFPPLNSYRWLRAVKHRTCGTARWLRAVKHRTCGTATHEVGGIAPALVAVVARAIACGAVLSAQDCHQPCHMSLQGGQPTVSVHVGGMFCHAWPGLGNAQTRVRTHVTKDPVGTLNRTRSHMSEVYGKSPNGSACVLTELRDLTFSKLEVKEFEVLRLQADSHQQLCDHAR